MKELQSNPNAVHMYRRGKHGNQKTINNDVYKILVEMIERLPKYTSHYSIEKHNDNILYLQPGTVLASKGRTEETSVFHLLVEKCEEKGVTPPEVI